MRLELGLQGLKLSASEAGFQRRRLHLAIAKFSIGINRVPDTHDRYVNQPIEVKMVQEYHLEQVGPGLSGLKDLRFDPGAHRADTHVNR